MEIFGSAARNITLGLAITASTLGLTACSVSPEAHKTTHHSNKGLKSQQNCEQTSQVLEAPKQAEKDKGESFIIVEPDSHNGVAHLVLDNGKSLIIGKEQAVNGIVMSGFIGEPTVTPVQSESFNFHETDSLVTVSINADYKMGVLATITTCKLTKA